MQIRSNIPEFSEQWARDAEKKIAGIVALALQKTAIVGEARVKGIIEQEAYDTGAMLRAVTSEVHVTPDDVWMRLGDSARHAPFVERGRLPGSFPNLDALVGWVGRRLRARGVSTRINITYEELKALARGGKRGHKTEAQKAARQQLGMIYLVGRKIATRGIKQKLIFQRLEDGLRAYARDLVQEGLQSLR